MKTFSLKKIAIAVTVALTGALIASNALAQTEELRNSKLFTASQSSTTEKSMPTVSSNGRLVQVGDQKGNLQPLKGFAKDLPLLTVLKQITPNGWVVKKNDTPDNKLDVQQLVSWDGGKSWIDTLSNVANNFGVNILVNWNAKEITLSPSTSKKEEFVLSDGSRPTSTTPYASVKPEHKVNVFELAGTETTTTNIAVGNSQAEALPAPVMAKEVATPLPVVAPVASWTLNTTKTLKENVTDWGKAAGYRVVWSGEDYPVDDARALAGEFDGDNGPIKQLSFDYGPKSRVQQPLAFQFFQNRTLVVENWRFEQQGFPQYSQQ